LPAALWQNWPERSSELASLESLPRPVPGRTGTTDFWSYWHRHDLRRYWLAAGVLCTEHSAVLELARLQLAELASLKSLPRPVPGRTGITK